MVTSTERLGGAYDGHGSMVASWYWSWGYNWLAQFYSQTRSCFGLARSRPTLWTTRQPHPLKLLLQVAMMSAAGRQQRKHRPVHSGSAPVNIEHHADFCQDADRQDHYLEWSRRTPSRTSRPRSRTRRDPRPAAPHLRGKQPDGADADGLQRPEGINPAPGALLRGEATDRGLISARHSGHRRLDLSQGPRQSGWNRCGRVARPPYLSYQSPLEQDRTPIFAQG